MYEEPIFLEPVFKERIWGGTKLKEEFGYDIPSETTGECWGISAHSNGTSIIKNGPLKGKSLKTVWDNHKELFGDESGEEFPLLIKLLDAAADLSVQVHPNDNQAHKLKDKEAFGKTECWYVVRAEPGAALILGHHAESKKQLETKMREGEWDSLLREVPIQTGDFFYVPSGTIHAIGKGALILETQQSSDTTYRVYDYDRTDQLGNKRELHLDKSIEVATVPHQNQKMMRKKLIDNDSGIVEQLVTSPFFSVYHIKVNDILDPVLTAPYMLATVLNGDGTIETETSKVAITKGDHFIIPASVNSYVIKGDVELVTSTRES
ncbi:mannose-6-phosphate isomerase, class I [Salibacterium salarium]|uniref:Mannose-6-phosphate isomerase n=1 Tax=Salibacterium salarium TaxID=284579 RepID=A0A428N228_9BACI|nr:mannose-6-phosphate isomerase, class I [Salibacterium salarium]RSL32501.1 mannose-6-phosphate isomerase, class I [Salibacterium salarium]